MITIYPENGHTIAKEIKEAHAETGKPVPARNLNGVTGYLAETPSALPITGTETPLTEYIKQPGVYFGSIMGATLTTALASYKDNARLYEIVKYEGELKAASPVTVRKERVQ